MNKVLKTLMVVGVIVAMATPALAEFKFNGYYRLIGYAGELRSGGGVTQASASAGTSDEEGASRHIVDQRLRAKLTYTLNENVAVVYYAEVDSDWGSTSNGGALGADGKQVQTKMVYLDVKSGDSAAQLGIIGVADNYQGVMYNDDMAGINFSKKMGDMTLTALWAKFYEGEREQADDSDMYNLGIKAKLSDTLTLGADLNYRNHQDVSLLSSEYIPSAWSAQPSWIGAEVWSLGVNGQMDVGAIKLDGFIVYSDTTLEANDDDHGWFSGIDGNAIFASVKGTMKIDSGDIGARLIYCSANDDDNSGDQWGGSFGQYEFPADNLMQFLVDAYVMNYGKERYAFESVSNGTGLVAVVASGNHKLGGDMYAKWGAGYFMAADEEAEGADYWGDGDTLGWELAGRIGKKYFDKVDVSLNLSYAGYGDFYDGTANNDEDPDSTYKSYIMVNVPF